MSDFKTNELLEKLNKIFTSDNPTEEEKEFVELRNLKLAEALIIDFEEDNARKIAKAILAVTDEPNKNIYQNISINGWNY
ncbi:hypothetical protein [Lacrimispora indolis]|uniref:hypothetical protein n=1 Tax=Lacrimispora indolis TaxID=69825 RepID=UPI0004073F1A|nr:hypothetical protein [[Clostridium] methoxybenzovorans]